MTAAALAPIAVRLALTSVVLAFAISLAPAPARALCCRRSGGHSSRSSGSRPSYGGGHHSGSHGGTYRGGSGGSSHKGGHYTNPRTHDHYGRHKP